MTIKGVEKWILEKDKKTSEFISHYTAHMFNSTDLSFISIIDLDKCMNAFTQLVAHKYIRAVMPEHSRSTVDRFLAATEKESEKYTIMTSKELQAIRSSAKAQIDAEYSSEETIGMKRKVLDPLDYQRKRAAIDEFGEEEDETEQIEVDEKIFFAINYDKFNMVFRNDSIVDFATERINRTAGEIVKAFLEFGKDKMKTLKEEDSRK